MLQDFDASYSINQSGQYNQSILLQGIEFIDTAAEYENQRLEVELRYILLNSHILGLLNVHPTNQCLSMRKM